MRRTAQRTTVFLNVLTLVDNPYPGLWAQAMERAGARIEPPRPRRMVTARRRGRGWFNLQWPEWALLGDRRTAVVHLARLLSLCLLARALGHRVLLTVHNQRGHDGSHPHLEHLMWSCLGLLSTHLHTFSPAGAQAFTRSVRTARRLPVVVIPHGDYRPVVGDVPSRADARATFDLDARARVCLTFGKLSAYKGLDAVVEAFRADEDEHARLLVCGHPADEATDRYVAALSGSDPRIVVVPRFLEQHELTAALVASDVVALPYHRVTNSGSALMSLTLARPVVLPRTPVFEELAGQVGPGWVRLLDGPLTRQDLVADDHRRAGDAGPDLSWCSWDVVSEALAELLTPVTGGVGRG